MSKEYGISVTTNEIFKERSTITDRLGSKRYNLERKISDAVYNGTGKEIFNAIYSFYSCQEAVFQKYRQKLGDVDALLIGTYLASRHGIDKLNSREAERTGDFDNKKVDYSEQFPRPVYHSIDIFLENMGLKSRSEMASYTQSFFEWNMNCALQKIEKDDCGLHKKLTSNKAYIDDRAYVMSFIAQQGERAKNRSILNAGKRNSPQTGAIIDIEQKRAIDGTSGRAVRDSIIDRNMEMSEYMGFDDIAGHEEVKEEFNKQIYILENFERFASRVDPRELISNYFIPGPPGTGKTTLIRMFAQKCNLFFMQKKAAELLDTHYGGTAKNIETMYKQAFKEVVEGGYDGGIVFVDEVESIARKRSDDASDSGQNSMNIAALTTNMDDYLIEKIITIMATNKPEMVDYAIRTGRVLELYMGYPETDEEVKSVYRAVIGAIEKYPKQFNQDAAQYDPNINLDILVRFTDMDERFKSGRVAKKLFNRALVNVEIERPGDIVRTKDIVRLFERQYKNWRSSLEDSLGLKGIVEPVEELKRTIKREYVERYGFSWLSEELSDSVDAAETSDIGDIKKKRNGDMRKKVKVAVRVQDAPPM
ncbi:MAG: AAA family ATPase [Candidatus Woesearchaeota archaeon]